MVIEVIRKGLRQDRGLPPLLLVHGAWHGAWCWDRGFMDALAARGHQVEALSLRGHGMSGGTGRWAVSRHGLAGYVADVEAVAARFATPPVLVGHSMGGFVVQRYLCERRRADGGVLLAPLPPTGASPLLSRLLRAEPRAVLRSLARLDLGILLHDRARAERLLFSPATDPALVDACHAALGSESFRAFLELLAPRLDVARATRPVAVLGAGADAIFTRSEVEGTAAAWGTRASWFPEMGHDMMLEPGWPAVADEVSGRAVWIASAGRFAAWRSSD